MAAIQAGMARMATKRYPAENAGQSFMSGGQSYSTIPLPGMTGPGQSVGGQTGYQYSAPTGQVLGTNTGSPGGGGGGGSYLDQFRSLYGTEETMPPGWKPPGEYGTQSATDLGAQARGEITSGFDAYFKQLDDILTTNLPAQKTAKLGEAGSQFEQGVSTLDTQKALQEQLLTAQGRKAEGQQAKTLGDISENIRNAFMAGNVYLGARGAGDSSAANQYSYALTKMGSKQRGDVQSQYAEIQNQIADRQNALQTTYTAQIKDLEMEKNQYVQRIGDWFNEQQSAIKQAVASGQIQKGTALAQASTNLMNIAVQQLQTIQTQAANKKAALEEWAMNNSSDINSLRSNLAQVGSPVNYTNPQAQTIRPPSQTTGSTPGIATGYGSAYEDENRSIFG